MSWSQSWIDAAGSQSLEPRYVLETVSAGLAESPVLLSSHAEGPVHQQVIIPEGCSVRWGQLSLDSWNMSASSLTVATLPINLDSLREGTLMQLRMGWAGWDLAEYEPVWVGVLRGAVNDGRGRVVLSLQGIEGSLFQRWRQLSGAPDPRLFAETGVGEETTLVSAWSAGSDIQVHDETIWARPTGGTYGLLITPTTGDPFYLTADTFGVVNVPIHGDIGVFDNAGLSSALDTAPVPADAGDTVRSVVLDEEHPIVLALRIITSDLGDGDNGDHDVYPYGWGLGLPVALVDVDDALVSKGLAGPDGLSSPSWWLHLRDPVTVGQQWLSSWLAAGGFYLCQRQGALTIRGFQPFDSNGILFYVDDLDIIDITYEAFAGPSEGERFVAYDHADMQGVSVAPTVPDRTPDVVRQLLGSLGRLLPSVKLPDERSDTYTGTPWSRPTQGEREVVVPVFGTNANRDAWLASLVSRIGVYATRRLELCRVRLVGLDWGRAAPGDAIGIVSFRVDSRRGPYDLSTKGGRHIVIKSAPDLFGLTTELITIYVPPDEEG